MSLRLLKNPITYFVLAAAVMVVLHLPVLSISPSFDDWPAIKTAVYPLQDYGFARGTLELLKTTTQDPYAPFWRPLSTLLISIDGGRLFWPQLSKLLCIIGIGLLIVKAARLLGLRSGTAWAVGAIFFLHQGMILGGEPDMWGDVISTGILLLLFCLALWVQQNKISRTNALLTTAGLSIIMLLGKEAGAIAFVIPAVVLVFSWTDARSSRVTLLWLTVCTLVVITGYLLIRTALGLTMTLKDPYYQLHLGGNILYNLALSMVALLSPVSTVRVYMDGWFWRGLAALWLLLLGGLFAWQLWRRRSTLSWKMLALLIVLFFAVQGPSLLMSHINESNFTRSLPFGLLVIAVILERSWPQWSPALRRVLLAFFVLWLGFSVHADHGKVRGIADVHAQSAAFLARVKDLMPVPPRRPVIFAAQYVPKGYSSWSKPVWELARGGDADDGLKFEYNDRSFQAQVKVMKSLDSLAFMTPPPDFIIDKTGAVRLYRAPSVIGQ